ncbi:ABC transporter ATP-binding protein [Gracilibacillus kekensis]|uniref:Putative ABC transport system ATP-binding protein n=1 Tax=Gracilibacillus kekensis TaxID=1027249 RepID=A0A1M7N2X5_9BACI|nr:ABC transporter ATP-binding protein [Gracilibacillus kekensis]SHM97784.1 putative ABC transport system ATP-binding protein [Gracilibacillus kekensis]
MNSLLEVRHLGKSFGKGNNKVQVLKDINFTINKSGLTALRGRSGSGKTTLLNLIGTLDKPTEGDIYFQNKQISQFTEKQSSEIRRLHMGIIFQSYGLVPLLTVEENIEFGLRITNVPRAEWKKRIDESIHLVGLAKRRNHRPFELSGGEQQRVAIARAIAPKPPLILADEPTAELDSNRAFRIINVFQELTEKDNMTILMTTHDPEILEMLDNVYALEDGQLADEKKENHA